MALGSTQHLTEMSTRNLPGGKERQAREADKLTATYEPIVYKMWEPRRLITLWAFTACYGMDFFHDSIDGPWDYYRAFTGKLRKSTAGQTVMPSVGFEYSGSSRSWAQLSGSATFPA
jgi:hypothetical protein